jgi:hypothetical protein
VEGELLVVESGLVQKRFILVGRGCCGPSGYDAVGEHDIVVVSPKSGMAGAPSCGSHLFSRTPRRVRGGAHGYPNL